MHTLHRGSAFAAIAAWESQPGVQSRLAQIGNNIDSTPLSFSRKPTSLSFREIVQPRSGTVSPLRQEISKIFGGPTPVVIHSIVPDGSKYPIPNWQSASSVIGLIK